MTGFFIQLKGAGVEADHTMTQDECRPHVAVFLKHITHNSCFSEDRAKNGRTP